METPQPSQLPKKPPLQFPDESKAFIDPYLQRNENSTNEQDNNRIKPFLTLTYAQSLDSKLSLAPGTQTILSGPETKAMTHYLRSKHDAILVGVGTAVADDPALNCRIEGIALAGQPRPVILDPKARWSPGKWPNQLSACMQLAQQGIGKGPARPPAPPSRLRRGLGEGNHGCCFINEPAGRKMTNLPVES